MKSIEKKFVHASDMFNYYLQVCHIEPKKVWDVRDAYIQEFGKRIYSEEMRRYFRKRFGC